MEQRVMVSFHQHSSPHSRLSLPPFLVSCDVVTPLSFLFFPTVCVCDLPNLSVACSLSVAIRSPDSLFLSPQLIASNMEGKSSPSEVLVCTTNPDKPGPPSTPCVTAATPYGFTVTWGKDGQQSHKHRPQRCGKHIQIYRCCHLKKKYFELFNLLLLHSAQLQKSKNNLAKMLNLMLSFTDRVCSSLKKKK